MGTPNPPRSNDLKQLIDSAHTWMTAALDAWTEEDYAKVSALAPLAVEHLGKAVLWQKNPVLLLPLQSGAEAVLLALATDPRIADPKLRTVGLGVLLSRLRSLLGSLPVNENRCKRVADVRNGAMHVGTGNESSKVFSDCLALCNAFLGELEEGEESFYGEEHQSSVLKLLDESRSDLQRSIDARRARAQRHLADLKRELHNDELYAAILKQRESEAERTTGEWVRAFQVETLGAECPECGHEGRLFGEVTLDQEMDWDVEPLGGGQYEPVPMGLYWVVQFDPRGFECNVCHLDLDGTAELDICGLDSSRRQVEPEDLGSDFDPDLMAESYGLDD